MSRRRIEALKNLVERGATEGEREAARKALDIHRQKTGLPHTSNVRNSHRGAPFVYYSNAPQHDFTDTLWLHYKVQYNADARTWQKGTYPQTHRTWPEAVDVEDHPNANARVRLEVSTRAEMFSSFRDSKPITIRWRSEVWRTEGYAGTCEDNATYPPRFYVTINTARLTKLS